MQYSDLECPVRKDVSAHRLTSFGGGGTVAELYEPRDVGQFAALCADFRASGREYFLLGGGSNVIINDGICATPIVSARFLNGVSVSEDKVTAQCGARLSAVLAAAHANGLKGLEFLCGVPCSVGGAVAMNAGAFGAQIGDYIDKIDVLSADCTKIEELPLEKSRFSYRQGIKCPVLSATFRLERCGAAECRRERERCLDFRRAKQPKLPSCGSVFKNGDIPSGKLIDMCGLKGKRIGNAQVSELHANFIVNLGGATATDFLALAELCEREVKSKFGIELQREFILI